MLLYEASSDVELAAACYCLMDERKFLPKFDHVWVSQKFFLEAEINSKPKFNYDVVKDLWHYSLSPPLFYHQPLKIDRYFATPLFVWMPSKVMKMKVCCQEQGCSKELTSVGLYFRTYSILGMKSCYNIVAVYLECKKQYMSWNNRRISELGTIGAFSCCFNLPVRL